MRLPAACAFVVAASTLSTLLAQAPAIRTDEDYSKTMKEVGPLNMTLRKALTSASEADVASSSARLETLFKDVQAYWEAKKVEDASGFAKNAVTAAHAISQAAAAHDMAAANTAATTLGAQCTSCHMAHRERAADGSFHMK